jgi:imidazolonepropionase-like amidohydrolase
MSWVGTARLAAAFAICATLLGETKVLENFTLIDGTGKPPVAGAALVIVDGRITFAGPKSKVRAPAGAERIDLTGKYVIPGIMNLHGHVGSVQDLTQDPKYYTRENVFRQLKTYVRLLRGDLGHQHGR